jgi:ferric-dicitrate binding protein FerR (iron transport regulator)
MTEQEDIEQLIIRFFQKEISEDELRSLDEWLNADAKNKAYFFQLKKVSDYCQHPFTSNDKLAESSWGKMSVRMATADNEKSNKDIFNRCFYYLKYAAIIIIALIVGWGVGEVSDIKQYYAYQKAPAYNEIHVEKGGRANTIILSDSTKVVLNAGTTFRYPSTFNSDERKVYLDGEAYFEVTKDKERPFVVKLDKQDITVLGTVFNVEAYSGEAFSSITLLSGRIVLRAFNKQGDEVSKIALNPNSTAVCNNRTGYMLVQEANKVLTKAWLNGQYKFKDELLGTILKRLENYYDVNIHVDNPDEVNQMKYTGTFSLDQDIMEVLQIIDYEGNFNFKHDKRDIYISRKR